MNLSHLILSNFKNYSEADLNFSDKINCLVGGNGAGKTNVMDAIYYLSFCKSYFNPIDSQNINHDADFFALHGFYHIQNDQDDKISCIQKRNQKKQFRYNSKDYERLADHIGKIPLVMISPYDRDLINEGSETRRKYIDGVISQFDKVYLNDLLEYNKALLQRNILLKNFAEQHYFDELSLTIWDEKLIELGESLHEKRKDFLRDFNPLFEEYYRYLSGGSEQVEVVYSSQMGNESLKQLLENSLQRDRIARYTTQGIHKDDLIFLIDGFPVKKFGSQGQQKSFVVAIKLAQFEYTRLKKGFKPILLFDDIFDKLDDDRVSQIVELVSQENFGQVFITDTQHQRIKSIFEKIKIDHKIFFVEKGTVREIDD
ncbi:MAG: DNA replication and repair protein RecF [Bacteroidales bacterium]|nr:DNA replication and repair protein RecF [Bacteroidales bacterium]